MGLDLSVLAAAEPTGVERAAASAVDALAGLSSLGGVTPVLLAPAALPGRWRADERLETHEVPAGRGSWRERVLPRLARELALELVHLPVVAVPWRLSVPALATVHELPWCRPRGDGGDRSWRHRLRTAHAARVAARLVCVSAATAADLRRLHPRCAERVVVLPHALPPVLAAGARHAAARRDRTARGPRRRVLAVGRLRRKKNLGRLLEAVARLPDVELELVGPDGDDGDALRRRASRPDLAGRVVFVGAVDDRALAVHYRRADVLAHPALVEGFGLPVLEALAHGLPVLSARDGAAREALGEAALAVDGRSVDALAAGLERLLSDDALVARLAARAAPLLAERDAHAHGRRLLALWREVADR